MEKYPCFISTKTPSGRKVKYRTKTYDGKVIEMELWDLLNKYGADTVLQMRREIPEFSEDE